MVLLLCSFWLACTTSETKQVEESAEVSESVEAEPEEGTASSTAPEGHSEYYDHADIVPIEARDSRRISVRALKKSLEMTTGVVWLENGESPFDTFSGSLGIPDYAQSIAEDLDPGMMFYKQLIAAADYSCDAMVVNDLSRPLEERLLLNNISEDSADPTEVKTALAKALVRFHGEEESLALDSALVTKWYDLWVGIHDRQPAFEGEPVDSQEANLTAWQMVCEALILSPRFYTY